MALRKAKIVYNFGLAECNRVNMSPVEYTCTNIYILISGIVEKEKKQSYQDICTCTFRAWIPIENRIHQNNSDQQQSLL